MSELEQIKDILREELTGYLALQDLLQKERRCLVDLRFSEIEELSKKKDLIMMRLRLLDNERLRITERLRLKMKTEKVLNLKSIYEITGDEDFLHLRSRLISLLQAISELNSFNRLLIDRSLNYVKNASSLLEALGVNTPGSISLSREV
jgi:flagellar biosynthesis/type III secretory pathway chaperone